MIRINIKALGRTATLCLCVLVIASCAEDEPGPHIPRFLDVCRCWPPYVENVQLDTCVYDSSFTGWASINALQYAEKLAPGEQLVTFHPLDPSARRTWEPADTFAREAFVASDLGWYRTIVIHAPFIRADQHLLSNNIRHPFIPNYYDSLRPYNQNYGTKYWQYITNIEMHPFYEPDPQPGTKITWGGVAFFHPEADTLMINGISTEGSFTVGADTSYGILAYRNGDLIPGPDGDTTYSRLRFKFFDPPPRLQNEEW